MQDKIHGQIDVAAHQVGRVIHKTGALVSPVRDSLFKRFPILAPLMVTFGVAATFFGMERLIIEIDWLNERPLVIFLLGLVTLIISGKLYQKLG